MIRFSASNITAPEGVKVTVKFDGTSLGYPGHTEGSLTQNNDKTYTFATDTYIDGYTAVSNDADNIATSMDYGLQKTFIKIMTLPPLSAQSATAKS